jgi:hypothetical protein
MPRCTEVKYNLHVDVENAGQLAVGRLGQVGGAAVAGSDAVAAAHTEGAQAPAGRHTLLPALELLPSVLVTD